MKLKNKVVLVTGAASERSIGWGIAKVLAAAGATVMLNDLPKMEERLRERTAELKHLGFPASYAPADVSQPDQVTEMVARTVREFGKIDVACSNAGIIKWEHFLDITPQVMRSIVDVNLKGNMLVCQEAGRQMIRQGHGGRIIITSSVQAYKHFPISAVYGGTKHAMHIFVGALALELAPFKITVNHFGPGWIQTPLNDPAPGQQTATDLKAQAASIPLHRAGTIEEMGHAALYFASPEAAYTTGAFLLVDGGLGIGKYPK